MLLYVGVAEDAASKLRVLQALTRKFKLHESVNLEVSALTAWLASVGWTCDRGW